MILNADFTEHTGVVQANFAEVATFNTLIVKTLSFEKLYAISTSAEIAPTQWETEAPKPTLDTPYLWMRTITRGTVEDGTRFVHDDGGLLIGISAGGEDGYSPIATVKKNDNGAVITITDKNGTTTATIANGKQGDPGQPGNDGHTPVRGEDYWTEEDVAEIKAYIDENGGSGGVSSWNDLTDKPFGEETGDPTLFEADLTFTESGVPGLRLWQVMPSAASLNEGEDYFVIWDSVGHMCKATAANFNGVSGLGLGNFALAGLGEDTEEPFLFGCADDGSFSACYTSESKDTVNVCILHNQTVVKTLDAKYLPMDAIDERIDAKLAEMPDVSEVGM